MVKEKLAGSEDQLPSFEEALARLERIVHELEEGDLGLADAMQQYEEGVKLLKQCHGLLDCAERKVELLSRVDASGKPIVEPFDDEASLSVQEKGQPRSRRRSAGENSGVSRTKGTTDSGAIDLPGGLF